MPVRIACRDNKCRVTTPGGVRAKDTTPEKAKRQATLLRAIDHGWKPTEETLSVQQAGALAGALLGRLALEEGWASKLIGLGLGGAVKRLLVPPKKSPVRPTGMKFTGGAWQDDKDKFYKDPQGREGIETGQLMRDTAMPSGKTIYRDAHGAVFADKEGKQPLTAAQKIKAAVTDGLERGHVEPTRIRNGKTRGKFKFPGNWKVGHAIKS